MSESVQQPQDESKPLLKSLPVYGDACCYGCFKIRPKAELPQWLCKECVNARAAEAEAKKQAEKPVTN
jgi:hypothetical protein